MLLMILATLLVAGSVTGAEIRYADVVYLDDIKAPPLQLKVLTRSPLTFSRDSSSLLGHVAAGQVVNVLAIGTGQYYIATRIATGPARGWMQASACEAPKEEVMADINQRRDRAVKHKELIERHEVAIGMSPEEVRASLGKPDKTTRTVMAEDKEEVWSYVTYRYLPQYNTFRDKYGQWQQTVIYQRQPIGHKTIVFRNGQVFLVEDHEEKRPQPPVTTIVPPVIIR